MLIEIIERAKLTFLPVLVLLGWWKLLSLQTVSESSASEYRGKAAKYVAEIKRAKKPLEEFNLANDWDNSLSPLMKAIRSGDSAKAYKILEESGEELYYRDFNGGNSLYWTVVTGNVDLFLKLLSMGVDPGNLTRKNENLLHIACSLGKYDMVKLIIEKCGLDPWKKDNSKKTPMDRY